MTQQVIQFITNHWMLVAGLVIVFIVLCVEEFRGKASLTRVSPQEVVRLMNQERAGVVDLRSQTAYDDGHIIHAMHILESDLSNQLEKLNKFREKPLIMVCDTGQLSARLVNQLQNAGFKRVMILLGGMNAWKQAELPVEMEIKTGGK